ncbi:hypothetical protein AAVH_16747, partial [Aphelenchoides avenae]
IDAVIDQVDQFLRSFRFGTNTSGVQSLEYVKEDKTGVTGFFDMLGDLFTNGAIGRFEDK